MSRKHFEFVAKVISESNMDTASKEAIAHRFANEFKQENKQFDHQRFISACFRSKK
jgi:hypothetical protein